MPGLTGVVIITGGSSGIGRCTAALFARRQWRVGLIARGAAGLAAVAAEVRGLGGVAATAIADVADSAALRDAADRLVAELGSPDVWINCAGNGVYGRFGVVPDAEYDRVTAVTYTGTVNGCRTALALMRPRSAGTIVNVCSGMAFHGLPLMTSYSGAKAAVRGFSQALRAELAIERSAIRVSTVFPPAVNTPFFSHAVSHMGWPAQPARPVYQPDIIASAVALAAATGRPEMLVTGTMVVFSLAYRLSPALIAQAVRRLGFDAQLTREPGAGQCAEPTLFEPSRLPSPAHGPFGHIARRSSLQLWLARMLAGLRPMARPASPSPPIRARRVPGPAPAGSAPPPDVS